MNVYEERERENMHIVLVYTYHPTNPGVSNDRSLFLGIRGFPAQQEEQGGAMPKEVGVPPKLKNPWDLRGLDHLGSRPRGWTPQRTHPVFILYIYSQWILMDINGT